MDEAAFRALFDAYMMAVWRYARRRCSSDPDADDVAAETFAIAWRRRDDLPADGQRLWLLSTARRVLANQRRSTRRTERLRQRVGSTEAAGTAGTSPEPGAGPDLDGRLWRALVALDADDRDLLLMRAWDELPVSDIAVLLGCSANAVSVRLYKAKLRLAAALDRTDGAASRTSVRWSRKPEGGKP